MLAQIIIPSATAAQILPLDPVDRNFRRATLMTVLEGHPLCKRCSFAIIDGLGPVKDEATPFAQQPS